MTPLPKTGPPARRHESGSSYVTALLALFVLTILGLALVVVTQNEVLIGANERTTTRVFYSAESALNVALGKALLDKDYSPVTVLLNESNPGGSGNHIAEQARATAMVPINVRPCDWCSVNANEPAPVVITSAVNAVADRVAWTGSSTPPAGATSLGQKTLGGTYEYGPMLKPPTTISLRTTTNPNLLNPLF